ncbi:MAG: sigma-70 region 2 family protein [Acidobacteriaceae bacterium]|nr:sigma-70 region 2 family protein [Acidobacteriaceae bacterium]
MHDEGDKQAREMAEAVARRSYGKLVAFVSARTHNVSAAEDALADAFLAALTEWPRTGCPANPEAWLLTVARRRGIDAARRERVAEAADRELQLLYEGLEAAAAAQPEIPDRRLGLIFGCTHPAIDPGVRSALILQVVMGLDAKTIASAFLTSPAAMGKRLVRAKDKIRQAGIPFSVPGREELASRLESVLEAIYAAFTEGWTDPTGMEVVRRDLTSEAIFLARLLAELLPQEPEALGLLALMLHADARRRARRDPQGEYIPLAQQDRSLWDEERIAEAEALLHRAGAMGRIGRYQLEAAVQSAHITRYRTGKTNWAEIVALYDALLMLSGSPVVAINRALAIAERDGARAGLAALPQQAADGEQGDPRLSSYQPYWATRADLLGRTGAFEEAHRCYQIAIGLERDPAVRRFLQARQAERATAARV